MTFQFAIVSQNFSVKMQGGEPELGSSWLIRMSHHAMQRLGWNGLGAYKSMLVLSLGRNPTQAQLDEISEQYVDRFKTAVKRYEEGRANLLAMSQWLVCSVAPENLLPIFGEYAYDDIFNRSY